MTRVTLSCIIFGALLAVAPNAVSRQPQGPSASNASPHRALLKRYCVTCHNDRTRTAGITLEKLDVDGVAATARVGYLPRNGSAPAGSGAASAETELLEKVLRKVRAGDMPPSGAPRPDKSAT